MIINVRVQKEVGPRPYMLVKLAPLLCNRLLLCWHFAIELATALERDACGGVFACVGGKRTVYQRITVIIGFCEVGRGVLVGVGFVLHPAEKPFAFGEVFL